MREIFFQVTLSFCGAFVGALIQLLSRQWQIKLLKLIGGLVATSLLIWVGYELGVRFP